MKNNKKLIIGAIALILIALLLLFILFFSKKESKILPYVEEKEIKVLDSNEKMVIKYTPYSADSNKTPIDIDGIEFEDTTGTYSFYDYSETNQNDNETTLYSFKYDLEVPIRFTFDNSKVSTISRRIAFIEPILFDYYTGEVYNTKNVSPSGNIKFDVTLDTEDDYGYTDITWNDKTYRIGARVEISSKWDGVNRIYSNGSIDTYEDTSRITAIVYILAPKDYDGLMLALNNKGSNKQVVLDSAKMHEQNTDSDNKVSKLLETKYTLDVYNTKDDFNVIRINKIKKDK